LGSVLHSRAPWCGGGADGSCLPRACATGPCRRNPQSRLDSRDPDCLPEPFGKSKSLILRGRPNSLGFITLVLPVRIGHTIAVIVDPGTASTEPGAHLGNPEAQRTDPQSVSQPHTEPAYPLDSDPVTNRDPASAAAE